MSAEALMANSPLAQLRRLRHNRRRSRPLDGRNEIDKVKEDDAMWESSQLSASAVLKIEMTKTRRGTDPRKSKNVVVRYFCGALPDSTAPPSAV